MVLSLCALPLAYLHWCLHHVWPLASRGGYESLCFVLAAFIAFPHSVRGLGSKMAVNSCVFLVGYFHFLFKSCSILGTLNGRDFLVVSLLQLISDF